MTMKGLVGLPLAAIFGFLGGIVSTRIQSVSAAASDTIRASRFELSSSSGKTVAEWGSDSQGRTSLKFFRTNQREAVSVGLTEDEAPFVNLFGRDGKVRITLFLDKEGKPLLGMGDGILEGRVLLGSILHDVPSSSDDDWGLLFRAPGLIHDFASIGVRSEGASRSGGISVRTSSGKTWSAP